MVVFSQAFNATPLTEGHGWSTPEAEFKEKRLLRGGTFESNLLQNTLVHLDDFIDIGVPVKSF